ncbi:MAG: flavodoxin family protein [Pseudomonadales bacterium]
MSEVKHLLILIHSRSGTNRTLGEAVLVGARKANVAIRVKAPQEADELDLLWMDGVIFISPEHFGSMAGLLKDFFERTFYPTENQLQGRAMAIVIGTGLDGVGALESIQRICRGYRFREVQEALILKTPITETHLQQCEQLGEAMAIGLEAGIF